ncbi:putative F-box domain, FBD domain, leucine-rich repeat domain, L domain-containing protein [Medicago truncatula]|uniref:Putative F-box domain, FBD domain, leucine-rich repeat domain, L domain-containing protein n=1 Tax=Medicago truncatula TaxID=3880 RepID=A0A396GXA3_MEDTR|nr:putative F-box domain, FBD domain, leucine-rich repeat domain, L domain-containing protein [Medicago truncatula]
MSSQHSIPTVDRVSVLPDSVICHILSFLPTKESAATSILSKRWNPLWLSVLTLDFDDQNFTEFSTFRHFVYSVIALRNITLQTIQSFRLKCGNSSGFNPHDVKRFIHAIFQRGIQNLNLEMSPFKLGFKLPHCVFSCSNLTALKLKGLAIDYSCDFNFPLLKTLHLYTISFGRDRDCFLRLLKGCPILEDLETKDLLLHSSNSTGMYYFIQKYELSTFLNLTHMKIVFELTHNWPGKWKWLTKVLQHCPKLQNLTIHEGSSDRNKIEDVDWMDTPIVPECFSSQLKTCSLIGYKGMNCDFQFAKYILKNAKVLQTMTINASPVDINIKHQILIKLTLCPRGSTTCKISFD